MINVHVYCVLVCGRLLGSALLMGNIAANQGLVDQRSSSGRLLSGETSSKRFENPHERLRGRQRASNRSPQHWISGFMIKGFWLQMLAVQF